MVLKHHNNWFNWVNHKGTTYNFNELVCWGRTWQHRKFQNPLKSEPSFTTEEKKSGFSKPDAIFQQNKINQSRNKVQFTIIICI